MELEQLLNQVPDYAKDLKLNFGNVTRQTELTEQQTWGTVAACAIATRNPQLIESLLAESATHLNEQALFAAKAAAAIMEMHLLPLPPPQQQRKVRHHARASAHAGDRPARQ
jgi:alkyl hydroperoxide reductase subunit D